MPAAEDSFGLVGAEVEGIRFDEMVDVGGFGLVYRARHLGLDEPVAVKCLKLAHGLSPELAESFYARFRDETRIAYRLSQGNLDIVRSISSGTLRSPKTGNQVPYMVLEWLDGRTLNAELKARRLRGRPEWPLEEVVQLLDSAVTAVAYAQDQGVVHRDLKPGNLFITETRSGPRLKVLDFGLAKIVAPDAILQPSHQSDNHVYICSPSYGAPEQFSTKFGEIGPWTDVYSLALIMLEMLTGKKARAADNLSHGMLLAIDKATASPTPRSLGLVLPAGVERALERAVQQQTAERPKDARELWNLIRDGMLNVADLAATIANEGLPAQALIDEALARQEKASPGASPPSTTAPMPPQTPLAATHLLRTAAGNSPQPLAAGAPGNRTLPYNAQNSAQRHPSGNLPAQKGPTHPSPAAGTPAQSPLARRMSPAAGTPAQSVPPRAASSGSMPARSLGPNSQPPVSPRGAPMSAAAAPVNKTAPHPPARIPAQNAQKQVQNASFSQSARMAQEPTAVSVARKAEAKSGPGAVLAVVALVMLLVLGAGGVFLFARRHK